MAIVNGERIIRIIDDKPESIRFQRKYVMVSQPNLDHPNSCNMVSVWSTYDSSTGEYYLDDETIFNRMLWRNANDLHIIAVELRLMDQIRTDINHYTRLILEYANS